MTGTENGFAAGKESALTLYRVALGDDLELAEYELGIASAVRVVVEQRRVAEANRDDVRPSWCRP